MKRMIYSVLVLSAVICGCMTVYEKDEVVYIDRFDLSATASGQGTRVRAGFTPSGHPLTVAKKVYAHGVGLRPEGAIAFRANGKVRSFDALVALDDDCPEVRGTAPEKCAAVAAFRVWADGRVAWKSKDLMFGEAPVSVHVDLAGVKEIILETTGGRGWTSIESSNGDWLDARFTCDAGAELELVTDPEAYEQLGILTPPAGPAPKFNGADIWGVRPGHPVIFRVPVSGERPMTFSAEGLPEGVVLDAKGVLRGTAPAKPGNYDIKVSAKNGAGSASRVITLAVGEKIGLTPPMGWNSWNCFCFRLTQSAAEKMAAAMETSGLADHGWAYVNLDDWWMMNNSKECPRRVQRAEQLGHEDVIGPARDAEGRMLPNRSFPDMKGFTDRVHALGLKAGIYSGPGVRTCGMCEGSLGHELSDATSWADWGFDYLKYDWCSYDEVFVKETGWKWHEWENHREQFARGRKTPPRESFVKPYRLMNECLRKQNRDIFYSYCQYGMGEVQEWGREHGANSWRTHGDLHDSWRWLEIVIDGRIDGEYWKWCGPGYWPDIDMLIVGGQFSYGYDHPTFLTPNEQYTHLSIWAMCGCPLMIGCDLTAMDDFTKALLCNDAVIAVSQDRLGDIARRVRHTDAESVWLKRLHDGTFAAALVNRSPVTRTIRIDFDELGIPRVAKVRDLWRDRCEGKRAGSYLAKIPPHATQLIRICPVDCLKCD